MENCSNRKLEKFKKNHNGYLLTAPKALDTSETNLDHLSMLLISIKEDLHDQVVQQSPFQKQACNPKLPKND